MSIKCLQLSIFMIIKINRDYLASSTSASDLIAEYGDDRIIAKQVSDMKVIKMCIEITLLKQFLMLVESHQFRHEIRIHR